jgi:hypothetical protein
MRINSVPYYDNAESKEPCGVEMIHSIDYDGVDTCGNNKGLRYKKPDVSGLDIADFLSQQELEALWNNLDENTDEWMQVSAALLANEKRLDILDRLDGESDAEREGEGDNAAGESDDDDDEMDN